MGGAPPGVFKAGLGFQGPLSAKGCMPVPHFLFSPSPDHPIIAHLSSCLLPLLEGSQGLESQKLVCKNVQGSA